MQLSNHTKLTIFDTLFSHANEAVGIERRSGKKRVGLLYGQIGAQASQKHSSSATYIKKREKLSLLKAENVPNGVGIFSHDGYNKYTIQG
jgi:hypothetical protein